jgi:SAM-dependent methyltransferase
MDESFELNLANWNERASFHARSDYYAFKRFAEDPEYISDVVRFDVARLGDLRGLRGVHLQCHIGTDTLSLQRLGAEMVGVDFSPAALTEARRLAEMTSTAIEYVEANAYDAPSALGDRTFDLVFTGVGAICWLPDIRRWAQVVSDLLVPGGRLFIREGHPVLWAVDETRADGLLALTYAYFEHAAPFVEQDDGTYVDRDAHFKHTVTHSWNHGVGEIITALAAAGLQLTMFVEHDSVPWEAIPGQMERTSDAGEWRLADRPERLPHSYTLLAVKVENPALG